MATRNTIQCSLVLEAVQKLRCHATADEVYEEIAQGYPGISRATVYRNLKRLSETGQIKKVCVPDGADRFDHRCDGHYHIKCESCGKVFDVDMDEIPNINQKIKDAHGFKVAGCDIVFTGICPKCLQKQ